MMERVLGGLGTDAWYIASCLRQLQLIMKSMWIHLLGLNLVVFYVVKLPLFCGCGALSHLVR